MSYELLSKTSPVARKEHRCIWCGEPIPKGAKYIAESSIFDGLQNHHWHDECWDASQRENDGYDWEFMPYENVRPEVPKEKP